MTKTIDITSRLTREKPVLKIGDKEYQIDNSKNAVFTVQAKMDQDIRDTALDDVLEILLGKKAVQEINKSDISFADYQIIFIAAMAGAMNEEFEVIEARFQASKQAD